LKQAGKFFSISNQINILYQRTAILNKRKKYNTSRKAKKTRMFEETIRMDNLEEQVYSL